MARSHHVLVLVGFSFLGLGSGCVSSEKYVATKMRADSADESSMSAQSQATAAEAKAQLATKQADQFRQMVEAKEAINQNLTVENNDLRLQLAEAQHRYESAVADLGKAGGTALPVQLVSELTTFAQQNPDVVEFDEKKGLIKFKSDVTFSAGSAVVKPETKVVIDKFAAILNGPTASQYDLMVVGHTDNVPVSNPITLKNGHLDNWYLSAHRAIAVSKALQSQGTAPHRVEVAGCGDQRPLAPNDNDADKARNRRVEVFILPTQSATSAAPTPAPAPVASIPQKKPTVAAPVRVRPLDKDSGATAQTENKPFLSK